METLWPHTDALGGVKTSPPSDQSRVMPNGSFLMKGSKRSATTNKRPWDLMDWVKQRKLPAVEAIRYQGEPCHDLPDLWNALHGTYNAAAGRPVNADILQEAPSFPARDWRPFSFLELEESLSACAGNSAPGPDHITWSHLKDIVSNEECANLLLRLANACITYAHWPTHFKESVSVIIPKLGKPAYDTPKAFRPIVLLNTIGKLIEKMLSRRMQFDAVKHNVLHPNQLGGVIQRSTEDAGVFLTHLVRAGWAKNLKTSVIAFDIAQFFPSLNHELLVTILRRQGTGFPSPNSGFLFMDYLIGRSTQFLWNSFLSYACDANVGMGQGSALSPILSALYIAPLMFIFDRRALAAKLNTSLLSFVEKMISTRLQFDCVHMHEVFHPNPLSSIQQRSTESCVRSALDSHQVFVMC